jgi:hypothetical protein
MHKYPHNFRYLYDLKLVVLTHLKIVVIIAVTALYIYNREKANRIQKT